MLHLLSVQPNLILGALQMSHESTRILTNSDFSFEAIRGHVILIIKPDEIGVPPGHSVFVIGPDLKNVAVAGR
jgi:hypothetical protein